MRTTRLSRRDFLKATATTMGVGILAACTSQPTAAPAGSTPAPAGSTPAPAGNTPVPQTGTGASEAGSAGKVIGKAGTPQWTVPDLTGKTFTVWGLQFDPHIEAYARLTNHFQQMTGAKATVAPQPWPIEAKVIAAMSAGIVPDAVCIMGKQCLPLILQDALLPVDDLINKPMGIDVTKWYSPVAVQAYEYNGHVWGVPIEGNMVSGITNVRTDFLKDAGPDVEALWPANAKKDRFDTFDEMWNLASRLMKKESDGTISRYGLSSRGWDCSHLFGNMRTLGRDWWDPTNRKFNLNSDEAVQAMQLQVTKPVFDLKIETQLDTDAGAAIQAGKVAMACGNAAWPGSLAAAGVPADSVQYPSAVPGKEALYVGEGGWGFVVPKQAKAPNVALEFLKYMSTYDGQLDYAHIYGGDIPGAPLVGQDPTLFPDTTVVGKSILRVLSAQLRTVYYGSDFGQPGDMELIVNTKIDEVRMGKYQPAEACQLCQKQLEDMLAKWDSDKKKA